MSSAQLEPRPEYLDSLDSELPSQFAPGLFSEFSDDQSFARPDAAALKQQVAARLAEHRARRQRNTQAAPAAGPIPVESPARAAKRAAAARISAAVAERYANSETYRSFLSAQAEQAIHEAEAAVEVAARNAQAVAAAQLDLLDELNQYAASQRVQPTTTITHPPTNQQPAGTAAFTLTPNEPAPTTNQQLATNNRPTPLTVRLYEPVIASSVPSVQTTSHHPTPLDPFDAEALDDEIAFRQAPVFESAPLITEIPANLIEFPRQLIAARRARPRLAEGPLREEGDPAAAESSQLRIFEVEPAQLSAAPALSSAAPEWTSIMLDAHPLAPIHYTTEEAAQLYIPLDTAAALAPLQTAPLELRIMASAVDTAIVLATLLTFTAAVGYTVGPLPSFELAPLLSLAGLTQVLPLAAIAAGGFLALTALYQILFFTFSDATPGMAYARIGLCTFSDENPTRAQMRRRALAFFLSACPLGLGLIWSWIDTDRLGWHDRLSRMYQRSY